MTERHLPPYPAYKPSGVDWLGHVPAHWEVRRLKSICRFAYGDSLPSEARTNDNIPVYGSNGVVGFHSFSNTHGQCLIIGRKGSFGKVHYSSDSAFAIDTTFYVDKRNTDADIRWLYYLLCSLQLDAVSRDSAVPGLNREDAYSQNGPLPPLAEQRAIVRYLDHADHRIQRYIEAKEKLITLLHEARQSTIHRAVTRGLDPDVPLKPSGVEWLGDVPAHWEISRVKSQFISLNHRRVPLNSVERGEMKERRYDYYGASGVIDKVDDYLFDDDLLLIAEDGANLVLRNLPLAIIARGKFWVNNHAHILKPRCGNLEFLAAVMEGLNYAPWISGAAQPKLTKERLMNIAIAVPPKSDQDAIMAKIAGQTSRLSAAIDSARRQVERMHEYRASLIAHVVTGKLDVRVAAAQIGLESAQA